MLGVGEAEESKSRAISTADVEVSGLKEDTQVRYTEKITSLRQMAGSFLKDMPFKQGLNI